MGGYGTYSTDEGKFVPVMKRRPSPQAVAVMIYDGNVARIKRFRKQHFRKLAREVVSFVYLLIITLYIGIKVRIAIYNQF